MICGMYNLRARSVQKDIEDTQENQQSSQKHAYIIYAVYMCNLLYYLS